MAPRWDKLALGVKAAVWRLPLPQAQSDIGWERTTTNMCSAKGSD